MSRMTDTPELAKMQAARERGSDEIGSFIDWLGQQGYVIARWERPMYRVEPWMAVYDQARAPDIWHRATSRSEPALCGAQPKHGAKEWWGQFRLYAGPPHLAACPECERRYEAGDWPERQSETAQLFVTHRPIEQWLADYFHIDLDAVERERQALLTTLRESSHK